MTPRHATIYDRTAFTVRESLRMEVNAQVGKRFRVYRTTSNGSSLDCAVMASNTLEGALNNLARMHRTRPSIDYWVVDCLTGQIFE